MKCKGKMFSVYKNIRFMHDGFATICVQSPFTNKFKTYYDVFLLITTLSQISAAIHSVGWIDFGLEFQIA
jgi:hypothetical protein